MDLQHEIFNASEDGKICFYTMQFFSQAHIGFENRRYILCPNGGSVSASACLSFIFTSEVLFTLVIYNFYFQFQLMQVAFPLS
jgi:hypothetical protein